MTVTRRGLLKGLAGTAVGLPLLASLAARRTRAQITAPPKRLVVLFHPNGVVPDAWQPTPGASPTDFTLGRAHDQLTTWKDRLVYLSGVDLRSAQEGPGEPHQIGMGGLLTGWSLNDGSFIGGDGQTAGFAKGISVDQRIAAAIGATNRFASLELGVRADAGTTTAEPRSRMIYAGDGMPLPPTNDPRQLWTRLFSDGTMDGAQSLAVVAAQRRSVLDAVQAQTARMAVRLAADDRAKLDAHLSLVRDLEQRLAATVTETAACAPPAAPPELVADDEATMQQVSRLMIDQLALALACDHTRVGSIQYSNALNHIRFPWLDSYGDGHNLSHAGPSSTDAREQLIARDRWYAGEVAYLLERLDGIPEGDGTLLDHTLIVWGSELSVGNVHSQTDMPFVLAGGLVPGGRLLAYDHASHNDLLLSILRAFDVDDATFGDPAHCTGPLAGLL